MARFTLPRDIYHGKGSLEVLKTLKGKKAIVVVGGGSMKMEDEVIREHLHPDYPDMWADTSEDRKSTRLNSSHSQQSRMPSSA